MVPGAWRVGVRISAGGGGKDGEGGDEWNLRRGGVEGGEFMGGGRGGRGKLDGRGGGEGQLVGGGEGHCGGPMKGRRWGRPEVDHPPMCGPAPPPRPPPRPAWREDLRRRCRRLGRGREDGMLASRGQWVEDSPPPLARGRPGMGREIEGERGGRVGGRGREVEKNSATVEGGGRGRRERAVEGDDGKKRRGMGGGRRRIALGWKESGRWGISGSGP
ncbi:hypothetical protein Tco_0625067 [Tanacetum coccineum]|uniref:Uncharacterized protein n=1 Tax=Tanacetum coccineum TaxID=301880 RepID=A0ABQ4WFR0_9ASTR